jgi:hypothetical protein
VPVGVGKTQCHQRRDVIQRATYKRKGEMKFNMEGVC